ncbi:MAG: hypothetical protein F4X36_14090, partial [Gammaproteobacteria bacterium]|nr:hypothetical protein [Gammaproteobacteria bacterium]
MALTIAEFMSAIRLPDAPDAELQRNATRVMVAAQALAAKVGPGAPEAVRDEATIRVGAWLFDSDPTGARGEVTQNALRSSGALALLGPWRRSRSLVVDRPTGDGGGTGETGGSTGSG